MLSSGSWALPLPFSAKAASVAEGLLVVAWSPIVEAWWLCGAGDGKERSGGEKRESGKREGLKETVCRIVALSLNQNNPQL